MRTLPDVATAAAPIRVMKTALCSYRPRPLASSSRMDSCQFLTWHRRRRGKADRYRAGGQPKVDQMAFGALTSLAEVKAWLQTGQSAFPVTDDELLTRLVTSARAYRHSWLSSPIS